MAIRTLDDNLNIISALPDEPTEVGGMGPGELKAAFDEAGNIIKGYVNDKLIPDTEAEIAGAVAAAEIASGNIPTGGASGQVLTKSSSEDYDYGWQDPSGESEATPNAVIKRDANGRAQVAEPEAAQDIATKGYVDLEISVCQQETLNYVLKIGDVKQTVRTDLGDKWALCNGANIRRPDYPELFDSLTSSASLYSSNWETVVGLTGSIKGLSYTNGKYIFYGITAGGNAALSHSTTLSKTATWTVVQIQSTTGWTISKVKYINGYYFAFFNNQYAAYSATLTYSGTSWPYVDKSGFVINDVEYGLGYYVFSGFNNADGTACVQYTATLGVAFTTVTIPGKYWMKGIVFDGTRFFVAVSQASQSNTVCTYTATAMGTWTLGATTIINGTGYFQITGVAILDGKYVHYGFSTASPYITYFAHCPTHNGTFTVQQIGSWGNTVNQTGFTYQNGYYIMTINYAGNLYFYYSETFAGTYSYSYKSTFVPAGEVLWNGEEYIQCSNNGVVAQTTIISGDLKSLPIYTTTGMFNYIMLEN